MKAILSIWINRTIDSINIILLAFLAAIGLMHLVWHSTPTTLQSSELQSIITSGQPVALEFYSNT